MTPAPTTSAALCRARNWQPGTTLTATIDGSTTTLLITAIGDIHVLARRTRIDHHDLADIETIWDLRTRPWYAAT